MSEPGTNGATSGVSILPSPNAYGTALETLFRELNARWDASAPRQQIVTDERVLRELALPPQTQTRLCYFAVPTVLLSIHREVVFPLAEDAGLVPASGDELAGWEGSVRAAIDALLQRARVVIGDVGSDDSRVWSEVRSAAQRVPRPQVALIAEHGQDLGAQMVPGARVFLRPSVTAALVTEPEDDYAASGWLMDLGAWLQEIGSAAAASLEDEAMRLFQEGLYRPAVIASASALEVALQEALDRRGWMDERAHSRSKAPRAPVARLLEAAADLELISRDEFLFLRELQRERNALLHTQATIHGRRARNLVTKTDAIVRRLRVS
jgi:hypothetical protein